MKQENGKWVKPETVDDWGSRKTYLGKTVRSRMGTVSHRDQTAPEIKAGTYEIKWSDGTTETTEVMIQKERGTVGDMGHTYETTSDVPYIFVKHHRAKILVELAASGVKVWVPELDNREVSVK